jgi:hypothetical protein
MKLIAVLVSGKVQIWALANKPSSSNLVASLRLRVTSSFNEKNKRSQFTNGTFS